MSMSLRVIWSSLRTLSSLGTGVYLTTLNDITQEGNPHAGLLGCAIEDQRSGRIQEIHRSRSRYYRQVRRQGPRPWWSLSDHGRAAQIPSVYRHRVSHARAGRLLFHVARI